MRLIFASYYSFAKCRKLFFFGGWYSQLVDKQKPGADGARLLFVYFLGRVRVTHYLTRR